MFHDVHADDIFGVGADVMVAIMDFVFVEASGEKLRHKGKNVFFIFICWSFSFL